MSRKIFIYDTTLHNSPEWPAQPLRSLDYLVIAQQLDILGVDYIEITPGGLDQAGLTASQALHDLPLAHARLTTAVRVPGDPTILEKNDWIERLVSPATAAYTLIVNHAAVQNLDDPARAIRFHNALGSTIGQFINLDREVLVEIEDFFDGYKRSPSQMNDAVATVDASGAHRVILNETSGRTLPWEAGTIVHEVSRTFPAVNFGVHFHDLGHSAVAGALTAVNQGVVHVQGSINGFGSRSGEANLCNIIPDLELKMGYECLPEGNLPGLLDVAQLLMGQSNELSEGSMRYVGRSELNPI